MEDFKEDDFILTRQKHIEVIKYLNKSNITLDGEEFTINDVSPILIDEANGIVLCSAIPCGSLIGNGKIEVMPPIINTTPTEELKDKMGLSLSSKNDKDGFGSYWCLSDISKAFLKENNIQYVHELQHYLEGRTLLKIERHTNNSHI
jgi:hypothetical protein